MTTNLQNTEETTAKRSQAESLLVIDDLTIQFNAEGKKRVTAVKDVNFNLKKGETVALVGESGCGKSVTSLSIMGLIPKHVGQVQGSIKLNGRELNGLSAKNIRQVRGKDVAMIFQEPMTSLNPVHKIGKQIGEMIALHTNESKDEIKRKTIDMLQKVGIPNPEKVIGDYPHHLSGGMRQRVMIAMAMACNPSLLIADEPTTALDVTIQAQILELMNELKENFDTTILLITHDLGVVAEVADRVMVMYYGQIVEEAEVNDLFFEPKHPYTMGLLNSMPSLEEQKERLAPIEGNVPGIGEITEGCPFRFRCQFAFDKCSTLNPPLLSAGQQKVRCWLYEKEEDVS